MMVARHEMPGTADKRTCPGGYGMTRAPGFGHRPRRSDAFGKPDHTLPLQHPQSATADAIRTGRGTQIPRSAQIRARARTPNAKRLVRTGPLSRVFQALRARLPSFNPYGIRRPRKRGAHQNHLTVFTRSEQIPAHEGLIGVVFRYRDAKERLQFCCFHTG